jgi:hypothetical protein
MTSTKRGPTATRRFPMDTTDLLNSIRSRLDNWRRMVLSLHRDQTPTERIILYNCDLMVADIDEVLAKGVANGHADQPA